MDTHRLPVVPAPTDWGKSSERFTTFTVRGQGDMTVRMEFPHRLVILDRGTVQALADYLNDWLLDTE